MNKNFNIETSKFSFCIMNPPYDKSLHLKFLEKMIQISDEVVSIQPTGWLEDPTAIEKKSAYKKYENSISAHIKNLEKITVKDAADLFGIAININLGIYVCDENGGYDYKIKNTFPNNLFKNRPFPFKVGKYTGNENSNFVCLVAMQGHPHRGQPACGCTNKYGAFIHGKNKDGLTLKQAKQLNPHFTLGDIDSKPIAIFDTPLEAKNFYDMCNTQFWKFLCYKSTISGQVNIKFLPWPDNYKNKWTDEKLYKLFNLSDKEIEIVKNTMNNL